MEVAQPREQGPSREEVMVGRPSRPGVSRLAGLEAADREPVSPLFTLLLFVDETASVDHNL
jgi:hypothetical protein